MTTGEWSTVIVEAMVDIGGGTWLRLSDIVAVTDHGAKLGCFVELRNGKSYTGKASGKDVLDQMVKAWKYRGE